MTEVRIDGWNTFLTNYPNAHILQTAEWGLLKSSFGWSVAHVVVGEIGAQILFRHLPLGLSFAYIPKGPLVPSKGGEAKDLEHFWSEVEEICKRKHAIFLKVELNAWENDPKGPSPLASFSMISGTRNVQPVCTLIVDLSGSEEDVFNRMKPKTRYNVRLAAKKGVVVHPTDDLESFYGVMQVTSRRMGFHVHSLEYYRRAFELFHPKQMCELFVAEYEGRPLATVMVFACGRRAYYFYGASSDEERHRKPTYPLQWESIRWAKNRGCEEYDMWGIPVEAEFLSDGEVEEREDGLWGVYRFKRGFGGTIKRAVPPMDHVYNDPLYRIYLRRYSGAGQE